MKAEARREILSAPPRFPGQTKVGTDRGNPMQRMGMTLFSIH
jgi:hypothetical protein